MTHKAFYRWYLAYMKEEDQVSGAEVRWYGADELKPENGALILVRKKKVKGYNPLTEVTAVYREGGLPEYPAIGAEAPIIEYAGQPMSCTSWDYWTIVHSWRPLNACTDSVEFYNAKLPKPKVKVKKWRLKYSDLHEFGVGSADFRDKTAALNNAQNLLEQGKIVYLCQVEVEE